MSSEPARHEISRGDQAALIRRSLVSGTVVIASVVAGCATNGAGEGATEEGGTELRSLQDMVRESLQGITGETRPQNYRFEIAAPESLVEPIREQTFVGRWRKRAEYDPIQFEGLVARLQDETQAILRSRGYFNGSVDVIRLDDGVRVEVAAGPRTTVNDVELSLQGAADDQVRQFALQRWELPAGSFFETSVWQDSKRRLIDALNQQGFLRARIVSSNARIDPELTAAALSIVIDSGPRLQFGKVQVAGLERYDEKIVLDLRPFNENDPYTLDALLLYQARLRSAGYFSSVIALPDLDFIEANPDAQQVPIRIEVVELLSKRAALGIGYSTDEGPRGQVGLEHRNVLARNWQLESALVVSAKSQRVFGNIRTPYDADNYFVGFGGRLEREDIEGQLTERGNTYLGRGRRQGNIETFLSVQYQFEQLTVAPNETTAESVDSRQALVLGYSWNKRSLDSSIDPRNGYTISTQISGARDGFVTDQSFVRLYGRGIRFVPMPRESIFADGTLVLLGEFGMVAADSSEGIPSENLFRAGGAQSLRGYSYQSLGVREGGAIIGGRYLLLGSVEYQHRMSELYSLAAFFDYGNATDSRLDYEPVAGYGLGIRFRTPIGPINLDVAYGRQVERYRAHFSVGYMF